MRGEEVGGCPPVSPVAAPSLCVHGQPPGWACRPQAGSHLRGIGKKTKRHIVSIILLTSFTTSASLWAQVLFIIFKFTQKKSTINNLLTPGGAPGPLEEADHPQHLRRRQQLLHLLLPHRHLQDRLKHNRCDLGKSLEEKILNL